MIPARPGQAQQRRPERTQRAPMTQRQPEQIPGKRTTRRQPGPTSDPQDRY